MERMVGADFTPPRQKEKTVETIAVAKYETLSVEEQKEASNLALEKLRPIFNSIGDYAIFASTAMYLHGQKMKEAGDKRSREFDVPPGDLDLVTTSATAMDRFREQLTNLPEAKLDGGGQYYFLDQGQAKVLSGKIKVWLASGKETEVDFEIFYNTRILPKKTLEKKTKIMGFNVLNLEGLTEQYLNNLDLEARVDKEVRTIVEFLTANRDYFKKRLTAWRATGETNGELKKAGEKLEIQPEDFERFFELLESGDQTEMTKFLSGGLKTKIWKRRLNLQQLAAAKKMTVKEWSPTGKPVVPS